LRADVPIGIKTVQDAIDSIYGQVVSPYLEARLYSHGSFSFVFVTDHLALVEQYLYRDHGRLPSMPTVQFANRTRAHQDLSDSFQTIWDNAKQPDLHLQHVGVSEGIEGAQILNIFRYQDRQALGRRQIECLRTTRRGEEVSIRAITGRFYSQGEALDTIQKISTPDKDGRWVQVRLLLIDPVSSEAILRAITDLPRRASLRDKLISWDWNQHKRTDLYQDLKNTTRKFTELMEGGCKVEVRLSPAAISSAVLLTHSSAFVEQYLYGHSNDDAVVLGGEYPVFEYRLDDKAGVEQRVVRSCFDSVWDSYSMSLEEFRKRNWQEHFEAHHQQLLSSLGPDTLQQGNEAAVKPASARTPETASKPVGA
jgi:hypothetical protein